MGKSDPIYCQSQVGQSVDKQKKTCDTYKWFNHKSLITGLFTEV